MYSDHAGAIVRTWNDRLFHNPSIYEKKFFVRASGKRTNDFPPGTHPLPEDIDLWLLAKWRGLWPDEDLTGIETALGVG